MKFKVDENLPQELVSDLAEAGHDGETVVKEGMAGVVDGDLLEVARHEGRVLLTLDKGRQCPRVPADGVSWHCVVPTELDGARRSAQVRAAASP
jgi:hypothetical protein